MNIKYTSLKVHLYIASDRQYTMEPESSVSPRIRPQQTATILKICCGIFQINLPPFVVLYYIYPYPINDWGQQGFIDLSMWSFRDEGTQSRADPDPLRPSIIIRVNYCLLSRFFFWSIYVSINSVFSAWIHNYQFTFSVQGLHDVRIYYLRRVIFVLH